MEHAMLKDVKADLLKVLNKFQGQGEDISMMDNFFNDRSERLRDAVFVDCCVVLSEKGINPHESYDGGFFSDPTSLGWILTDEIVPFSCGDVTRNECISSIQSIIEQIDLSKEEDA